LKKRCKDDFKLLTGKIEYGFECNCFPCENLEHLDGRYRMNYGMSMISNLNDIRQNGLQRFIKDQVKKYRCPKCGELKSTHTNESIIQKTCSAGNLPYPLFACPKTGKGYQRGGIPPFCKGREGGIESLMSTQLWTD
jgi:ribosomal protein L37AE/L43A